MYRNISGLRDVVHESVNSPSPMDSTVRIVHSQNGSLYLKSLQVGCGDADRRQTLATSPLIDFSNSGSVCSLASVNSKQHFALQENICADVLEPLKQAESSSAA